MSKNTVFCISTRTRVLRFVADAPRHRRKSFLSFTDNVPFGDTLRVKGYSYIFFIILLFLKKDKRFNYS